MELIDRQMLIESIRQNTSAVSAEYVRGFNFVAKKIVDAPTIDAEPLYDGTHLGREYIAKGIVNDKGFIIGHACKDEIVRCKDCKYHYFADNRVPDEQGHVCDYYHFETDPNGYCHVGERREP